MLRRELFATLAFAKAAPAKINRAKPNILVIMPDQWRGIDLGCAGNHQVKTPNLDRLAKEGVHLADAVANCPVCTPARASLLTGKYPHAVTSNEPGGMSVNDLPFDPNQPTLPKALAAAGYFTGFIGKWHLHGGPRLPGFVPPGPARLGFEWWAGNICSHAYTRQTYFRNEPTPIAIPGYDTFGWTDLALEFLSTAKQRQQPWCLHLWYPTPHDPYLLPPGFEKSHDPAKIELRQNWIETPRNGSRRDIAGYYSAIACLDQQIGRVLANVPENTIVVFLSDHGDMLGSQGTLLKRKPWEESVRIPGIISWPDKIKPGVSHIPFSHVDVAPTLLGLAGLPALPKSQGFNYAPHLLGKPAKKALPDHAIILSYTKTESNEHAPWRGIRTSRWKYARFEDQPWVMYDLAKDPFELDNLATRPQQAKQRARFDRLIAAHMRRTGDTWQERFDVLRRPVPKSLPKS